MTPKLLANALLLSFLACAVTQAEPLRLQISDPIGDTFNTGLIDLTGMTLDFNTTTGAYTITVQASAAHPFSGAFRLNLFFLNPDTGLGISGSAMLVDNVNDLTFASPSTSAVLTGVDSNLTLWKVGDRVAINSVPFGTPSGFGSGFNSGVLALSGGFLSGTDVFGTPGGGAGAVNLANITPAPAESAVPEPGTGLLFGGGAFLLVAGTRYIRKRRA